MLTDNPVKESNTGLLIITRTEVLRRQLSNIQKQLQSAPTTQKPELVEQDRSLQEHINEQISLKNECLKNVSGRVRNCISELESLAIAPKRLNELNDAYEMENLVDNIKLNLYQEYKSG